MTPTIPLNTTIRALARHGRKKSVRTAWLTCGAFCICAALGAMRPSAMEVWIITDTKHPVTAIMEVRRIEIDAPRRIQAELTAQLPSDPTRAAQLARQRLSDGGATLQERFVSAYQGVIDAWSLGVVRIPAVVVDRRYVVYGDSNVAHAVSSIQKYRSLHP